MLQIDGLERDHFIVVAKRLGRDAAVRHLAAFGATKFYDIHERTARNGLILAMTKELFNVPTD